jgi:hypothetical protein
MPTVDSHPSSAPHELRANILYTGHLDNPYWAIREIEQESDYEECVSVTINGESWDVEIKPQSSGLNPRPSDEVESLYEYRFNCYGHRERKLPLLIQPRLDWEAPNGPESIPPDVGLATNVRIDTATNIEPKVIETLIPQLLSQVADQVDVPWNNDYLTETPHEYSSITEYERYYRIKREESRPLVSIDGIFDRLFELLAHSEGTKVVRVAEDGQIKGYIHQVQLNHTAANKLLDGPQRGKQFKYYHPKYPRTDNPEDPLYHPKIGCLFKKSWNNNTAVRWNEHDVLRHELEENLLNLLFWEGIPVRCDTTFVSDWHFEVTTSDREVTVVKDPTPQISRHQNNTILSALSQLNDRDRKILKAVATAPDSGIHVSKIKSKTDYSQSTIYRGVNNLDELVRNKNGIVQFRSKKIQRRIHNIFETSNPSDPQTQIIADTLGDDALQDYQSDDQWSQWRIDYGVNIEKGGDILDGSNKGNDRIKIRIRTIMDKKKSTGCEFAPKVINEGLSAWSRLGHDPKQFRDAIVEYDTKDGTTREIKASLLIEANR